MPHPVSSSAGAKVSAAATVKSCPATSGSTAPTRQGDGSVPLRIIEELDPLTGGSRDYIDQTTPVGRQPLVLLELRSIGASRTSCGSPDTRSDLFSANNVVVMGTFS